MIFSFKDLESLFMPGFGKVARHPNRLRKGFLKRSIFPNRISFGERKQGEKEKARRVRQMKAGKLQGGLS